MPRAAAATPAALLIAASGGLAALPALAEDDKTAAAQLQPVQVSGSRSFGAHYVQVGAFRDQDPLDVPLTNNVITREVLDAQRAVQATTGSTARCPSST